MLNSFWAAEKAAGFTPPAYMCRKYFQLSSIGDAKVTNALKWRIAHVVLLHHQNVHFSDQRYKKQNLLIHSDFIAHLFQSLLSCTCFSGSP